MGERDRGREHAHARAQHALGLADAAPVRRAVEVAVHQVGGERPVRLRADAGEQRGGRAGGDPLPQGGESVAADQEAERQAVAERVADRRGRLGRLVVGHLADGPAGGGDGVGVVVVSPHQAGVDLVERLPVELGVAPQQDPEQADQDLARLHAPAGDLLDAHVDVVQAPRAVERSADGEPELVGLQVPAQKDGAAGVHRGGHRQQCVPVPDQLGQDLALPGDVQIEAAAHGQACRLLLHRIAELEPGGGAGMMETASGVEPLPAVGRVEQRRRAAGIARDRPLRRMAGEPVPAGLDRGVALVDPPRRRPVARDGRAHAQLGRPPARGTLPQPQVGDRAQPLAVRGAGARLQRVGPELDDVVPLPVEREDGPGDDRALRVQQLPARCAPRSGAGCEPAASASWRFGAPCRPATDTAHPAPGATR